MKFYITQDTDGKIVFFHPEPFEGSHLSEFDIVVVNGSAYKAGEEPGPVQPTLEDQLAAIEAEHAAGEELLNKRILGVMLADGQSQAAKIAALQAAYMTLANETDAKLRALLPPTEGE